MSEASPIGWPLDPAHEFHVADRPTTNVGWSDDSAQIKSRIRVRDLAEVYTHDREVNAMLDLVPDRFPTEEDPGNTDRTFLEPTCGNGNFLVEILRRKLTSVTTSRYGRGEDFEYRVLRCLTSIYGIDISEDNIVDSYERMRSALDAHVDGIAVTRAFREAVGVILSTNISALTHSPTPAELSSSSTRLSATGLSSASGRIWRSRSWTFSPTPSPAGTRSRSTIQR